MKFTFLAINRLLNATNRMTTTNSVRCLTPILSAVACLTMLPVASALTPLPDGGYPGQNTAEGEAALNNLNTAAAMDNTGVGYHALGTITDADNNTAVGALAL